VKAAAPRGASAGKPDGERDALAKIAEMAEPDRAIAEPVQAITRASAPGPGLGLSLAFEFRLADMAARSRPA
jgi:hypothetical protein